MRVHVVDPSAYTPPYDRALCAALAGAGAEVELFTSRFAYGAVPAADGYVVHESFYRAHLARLPARLPAPRRRPPAHTRARPPRTDAPAPAALPSAPAAVSRSRQAAKLAQHVPDMLRYRRRAREADVVHFQWLAVQPVDVHLLPRDRPLVLTAHDVLPRQPRPGQLSAQRRLYERVDAVVVHSQRGRQRLVEELGVDAARVHVIPHGALTSRAPTPGPDVVPLPPELAEVQGPVVLCFGLMRPYKGIDLLLEAWRGIEDAELWIVGMPRMDIAPLRRAAPPGVRFVARFVEDREQPAFFDRADLVVLPYREIDQSGVASTALGFGSPLLLTDVGGFPDIAATGAARLVPAHDPRALHGALVDLLADEPARARMTDAAAAATAGPFAWETVARRTLSLYEQLVQTR